MTGQIWVGISAAGVFHTQTAARLEPRNLGTRADFFPEGQNYPEFGQCVHCLVMAPGIPDRLYQQNHCGMYRSDRRQALGKHRGRAAVVVRLSGGGASARPGDTLSGAAQRRIPAATCRRPRRRCGGPGTRRELAGDAQGPAAGERLFRRAAPGYGDPPAGAGRLYFGTGGGALFASADEGDSWVEVAQVPAGDLVGEDACRRWLTLTKPHRGRSGPQPAAPRRSSFACRASWSTCFPARRGAWRRRPSTVDEMVEPARETVPRHARPALQFDAGGAPSHQHLPRRRAGPAQHAAACRRGGVRADRNQRRLSAQPSGISSQLTVIWRIVSGDDSRAAEMKSSTM